MEQEPEEKTYYLRYSVRDPYLDHDYRFRLSEPEYEVLESDSIKGLYNAAARTFNRREVQVKELLKETYYKDHRFKKEDYELNFEQIYEVVEEFSLEKLKNNEIYIQGEKERKEKEEQEAAAEAKRKQKAIEDAKALKEKRDREEFERLSKLFGPQ